MSEDRYRDLSRAEQAIRDLRRDGYLPVDRNGRPRIMLGNGPESQLARATYPIQEKRPRKPKAFIDADAIKRTWLAAAASNYHGLPLNTFVTISWRVAPGISDDQAEGYHYDLLKLHTAWCRDERGRVGIDQLPMFAAIWAKEMGRRLGMHTHLLLYIPDASFPAYWRWLRSATHRLVGAPPVELGAKLSDLRLVHVARLNPNGPDQDDVFAYMMKGLEPGETLSTPFDAEHGSHLASEFFGIEPKFQGVTRGARIGNSGAIGPKSQDAWLRSFWQHSLQGTGIPSLRSIFSRGVLDRQLRGIVI